MLKPTTCLYWHPSEQSGLAFCKQIFKLLLQFRISNELYVPILIYKYVKKILKSDFISYKKLILCIMNKRNKIKFRLHLNKIWTCICIWSKLLSSDQYIFSGCVHFHISTKPINSFFNIQEKVYVCGWKVQKNSDQVQIQISDHFQLYLNLKI